MTITAVIKRPNLIIANTAPLTTTQSNPPIDLKNSVTGVAQNYLHNLLDVVEDYPQNGDTLVYDSTKNKYVVKPIVAQVNSLDGGDF